MLTLPGLVMFLDEKNSDYELIAHETPIRSTRDAEQYFDLAKAAPTLIVQTEHGLVAFIASSQWECRPAESGSCVRCLTDNT